MRCLISVFFFLSVVVASHSVVAQNDYTGQFQGVTECLNKKFSIAVHIVEDSLLIENVFLDDIRAAVDTLNRHFEPICVSFEICFVDTVPHNRFDDLTIGVHDEEIADMYDVPNWINMYFSNTVSGGIDPFGHALLGDEVAPAIDPLRDAIFLVKVDIPNAMLHEVGHYFGLYDTFENQFGVELVNGSNCDVAGDLICDTPADHNGNADIGSCRYTSEQQDANNDYYDPMTYNVMSLYVVSCPKEFTVGQYKRMIEIIKNGRSYLW